MSALCKRDLSVIVPVYNLENFIKPLLITLKHQELGAYSVEFLFVMNNCTDNSEQIIKDSGLECTIIQCEKQGCGCARNAAMEIAQGEYIWFMDGDDWLLSDTAIKDALDAAQGLDILRIPFESDNYKWPYFSMVWQYVMKREFIIEFRFPDYQPAEDDAFMDLVLRKAGYNRHDYLNMPTFGKPLYFYRYLREGSNMYRVNKLGEKI